MIRGKRFHLLSSIVIGLSAAACSGSDAQGPSGEKPTVAESTGQELQDRIQKEGLTAELVALAHQRNIDELTSHGLLYTLPVGSDHDILFVAPDADSFSVVERIGPDSVDAPAPEGGVSLEQSPSDIFKFYRPGEPVPAVLEEATARHFQSAGQNVQADAAPVASVASDEAEDDGVALPTGLAPQHTTSDPNHFQNDTHTYNGGATDTGCPSSSSQTQRVCWLNRTSGGYSSFKSTHATYHFGIFSGGSTLMALLQNGARQWEVTVLQGESWRVTSTGPWHCPGLFCAYYGYGAITHKLQWDGTGKSWHFGALYEDILRKD
jgi:hypothetical protein